MCNSVWVGHMGVCPNRIQYLPELTTTSAQDALTVVGLLARDYLKSLRFLPIILFEAKIL